MCPASLIRDYVPGVGDAIVWKWSGVPFSGGLTVPPNGFSVGDLMQVGLKTFILCLLASAITSTGLGVKMAYAQGAPYAVAGATSAVGATSVTITTTAASGPAGDGAVAKDWFKGGQIVLFTAGSDIPQVRGITGNTSRVASGAKNVTFYLDSPLTTAITVAVDYGEAIASMGMGVLQDTEIGHPVLGMPMSVGTSGQYIWVQTYGPIFASPQSGVGMAGATGVYWRHDGSLDVLDTTDAYISGQYAGFVMAESATHTQAAPFVFLQGVR